MMLTLRRARLAAANGEEGIAIILVIGVGAVLMLLVTMALAFSLSGVVKARSDQDWNGAMSAAYAGIENYKSKLANDNTYQQYGNPAAPFSSGSAVTLPTGTDTNLAFGIGTSGTWATVEGSGGAATYRYEVDSSKYSSSGTLRVRSTGRVGSTTRSVVADLRQQGFIDFLYYTDYEIQDPALSGDSVTTCTKYAWAGRPSSGCGEIAFGNGDVINGPMHSNDTIRACNATFNGIATTSYNPPSGNRYTATDSNNNPCSGQVFTATSTPTNNPTYAPVITMPPTNGAMKQDSRTDLASVPNPGCLYTGPTNIVFNADGTMTVRSPWTEATQVVGSPATSGTTPSMCGSVGTGSNQLGSTGGQTLPVPAKNLIFVQNVPGTSTDPNYWPTSGKYSHPTSYSRKTCRTSNGIGYPTTNEVVDSVATSYGCRNGDVFVKGAVNAQVTVASDNYVYITGDITYVDAQADILGIVGNASVWVWNPVSESCNWWCSYSSLLPNNRTINAAILSVGHSFVVQNYGRGGPQGTLTVNGAIAQEFRGIVSGGNNGYVKNYNYDARLRYIAPPKFLSPVSTSYGISVLVEVKTAMNADGSPITP